MSGSGAGGGALGSDAGGGVSASELALLVSTASIVTAPGHEKRVHDHIRDWAAQRPGLALREDAAGNITIRTRAALERDGGTPNANAKATGSAEPGGSGARLWFTAHTDHPAFVVERVGQGADGLETGTIEMSFRGGVMDAYFEAAPVEVVTAAGERVAGRVRGLSEGVAEGRGGGVFKRYVIELNEKEAADRVRAGDVGVWGLGESGLDANGILHGAACDDLSAVAAALAAMDRLRATGNTDGVGLLFTRAEEIGFIGAIAAVKLGTIRAGDVVIALENSRASAETPVGAGPIVRVGDRVSTFTPWVTGACAEMAETVFGGPAVALSSRPADEKAGGTLGKSGWQRRLMTGGACEASVYCRAGLDATCLCLALGNYHNMGHLDEVQAGTWDRAARGPARCAHEFISVADWGGLVRLLTALGKHGVRIEGSAFAKRLEALYDERKFVLDQRA